MDEFMLILGVIALVVLILGISREFWVWYWKINQLLKEQERTNMYLKQLVNLQLTGNLEGEADGNSKIPLAGEIKVKNTVTGEVLGFKKDKWENIQKQHPNQTKYVKIE